MTDVTDVTDVTDAAATETETPLLDIRNLQLELQRTRGADVAVLDRVSLTVGRGETVGIVGESGCGKSVLSLSVLGLLPSAMRISGGEIWYEGRHPLHRMTDRDIRAFRGNEIAMIFQDPMSSLNNGLTVGYQVTEALRLHLRYSRREAKEHAVRLFRKVGLPRPESLLHEYPHQLSGGMRQRVMIAIAIACNPGLLIADEPTTALDVTIQAQILDLMRQIREEDGTSILLISHDFGVIADMCDRILVMYAGQIVEEGTARDLFDRPLHPYTIGLLQSIPTPAKKNRPLHSIEGTVPALHERGTGCHFASRCAHATERCRTEQPELVFDRDGHAARCFLVAAEGGNRHAAV
ncbi:ABC transporter ATP-binding protein [Paenibacillus beijingensis]|uniref:Peptide ABC transporter ATP-binding protein n=1 Tax=Paenibacillus beijingensis TaxID=1126833 RepID=A0A0D5NLX1_9BACL|nr:ABC transporter ATP-binding protein [Paenibacillus beijingensis]AJY75933.1 peptide ABC transporter ATP-binding protein [Paenibacillus beijingensis]